MKPRPRVLLVDDAAELRALLTMQLAGLGCDSDEATSEDEAMARVTAGRPFDLVLVDVHLAPLPAAARRGVPAHTPAPPSGANLGLVGAVVDRGISSSFAIAEVESSRPPPSMNLPARLRAAGYQARIVTMSAGPAPSDVSADGHLPKPFTREQLAACVRTGLPAAAWSVPPPVSRWSEELAMRPLLESYITLLDGRARELEVLTRKADVRGLDKLLHALEGSAGSYGFDEITELARLAGDPLRAGAPLRAVLPTLVRLQKLCARARVTAMPGGGR